MNAFSRIETIIQEDVGRRGLRTDPTRNLITETAGDFEKSCRSIASDPQPWLAIVTGFFIPTGQPPAGETDGPLGALFLVGALSSLGIRVVIATDSFCVTALEAGIAQAGLKKTVNVFALPSYHEAHALGSVKYCDYFNQAAGRPTHLIALERVGPNHTLASLQRQFGFEPAGESSIDFLQDVPESSQDRCHTMRGRDITQLMSPAHWLFDSPAIPTLGIGDGGNEIGMGKIPWDVIAKNIQNGGLVACRVPTDHLIVAGISNWGAYGLAAGVRHLLGKTDPGLFDPDTELALLRTMVEAGPLVDGVTGKPTATVDGITWDEYARKMYEFQRPIAETL